MSYFQDKVIWITGASSGIGEALVYQLHQSGAKLIISARRKDELERVKSACRESDVEILPLDLSDTSSLESKVQQAEAIHDQVDILINNAGISQRDTALNTSLETDRKLMEVNYFGAIALSKYLLPGMIKRKSGHHVVVSSAVGIISTPRRSGYAATKHAIHGFYDALRAEHHTDNISVTLICPGYIETNLSYNALLGDGSRQNKMDTTHKNAISPEQCAKKIIKAMAAKKEEVYIGGAKEVFGIYLKRLFPGIYSKLITRIKVT